MDFETLMQFRATSRSNYSLLDDVLTHNILNILRIYIPNPQYLADMLSILNVFITGRSALDFFLRRPPDPNVPLSLLAPSFAFDPILHHLLDHQGAHLASNVPPNAAQKGIDAYARLHCFGHTIILCQSVTNDPLRPICNPAHTAAAIYVNPSHFGLLWPSLTLNRLSLVGASAHPATTIDDGLCALAVDLKLWPWMWPELNIQRQHCARTRYICPGQPRMPLDRGSLHGNLSAAKNIPLTSRIVFRLDNRPCRGLCLASDLHLTNKHLLLIEM